MCTTYIYYNNLGGKQTNTDPIRRIPQRKEKYNRRNKQKAAEPKKASQKKKKKRKKEKKRRTKDKKSNLFIGEAA